VTLKEQNLCLKYYQPLILLICFGKEFRSFFTIDIGSAGQRAAKLLAVKVGGSPKKSAAFAITAEVCVNICLAQVQLLQCSNHSQSLTLQLSAEVTSILWVHGFSSQGQPIYTGLI